MNPIGPVTGVNTITVADFVRVSLGNTGTAYTGTSTTSLAIGTGSKSLTMTTGKSFTVQSNVTLVYDSANYMSGRVTSYDSGTGAMVVLIDYSVGSGTYASWSISTTTYRFATTPSALTVSAVDAQPFSALGQLIKVGDAQRDIKSTATETQFSLVGIDQAMLGWVLGNNIKGSHIEAWHGFFDASGNLITTGGTGGLYQFFNGYVSSFAISEQWMEEVRQFVGTITVNASAIQLILQNRLSGRYTNDNSWQYVTAGDTSMNRVAYISTINYPFGKTA